MSTPELRHTVAIEVRAHMGRQRITTTQLAAATGISTRTLSRRLSAAAPFTLEEAVKVADALGVPVAELITPRRAQ